MLYEVVYTKFTRDGITRYNEVLPREKIIRLLEDANILVKRIKLIQNKSKNRSPYGVVHT